MVQYHRLFYHSENSSTLIATCANKKRQQGGDRVTNFSTEKYDINQRQHQRAHHAGCLDLQLRFLRAAAVGGTWLNALETVMLKG